MGILVYRDREGHKDLVGRIDFERGASASFAYDGNYLSKAMQLGEIGISETLPLDAMPFSAEEIGPYFRGLLPDGDIYGNLAELYQVPRSDYLSILDQMGCECIGALTFLSEEVDPAEYEPEYRRVSSNLIDSMASDPTRLATITASTTRLSLSGAQSKIAWFLPKGTDPESADLAEWSTPFGTAPSTHIIKIARKGEEDIALNELACSTLASACDIQTARTRLLPNVPGAITVERYDRAWSEGAVIRLHQEDFCQALGLSPTFKYQPQHIEANYPAMMAALIESTSSNPGEDKLQLCKRLAFCYAIGNADAHLKNFSLLYNLKWTGRRLAPLYDVTCIPLTGYATDMPFDFGHHRAMDQITEEDVGMLMKDLGMVDDDMEETVGDVVRALSSPSIKADKETEGMVDRILENSAQRIAVLRSFVGL